MPFLLDPETAAQAHDAGAGAEIAVALAGKTAAETGGPVEAVACVIWSGPKSFTVSGRYQRGSFVDLGLTALLQIGRIRVSVVSHFAFAVDGDPFFVFGERPEDYDVSCCARKPISAISTSPWPTASSWSTRPISARPMCG